MQIFSYEEGDLVVAPNFLRNAPVPPGSYGVIIRTAPNTFFGTPTVTVEFDNGMIADCLNYEIDYPIKNNMKIQLGVKNSS